MKLGYTQGASHHTRSDRKVYLADADFVRLPFFWTLGAILIDPDDR